MLTKKNIIVALSIVTFLIALPNLHPIHAQDVEITPQTQDQQTYTVQPGDSLSSIAQAKLNDENRWIDIYNQNRSLIQDPNYIYSGEVLTLPSANTSTTATDDEVTKLPDPKILHATATVSESISSVNIPVYKTFASYSSATPVVSTPVITTKSLNSPIGAANYQVMINQAAAQYNVSAAEMNHIIKCESGYNPNAYNPSGASGIAQFMPGTFNGTWNPYKNEGIWSAHAQIYAMALKMSLNGTGAWVCSRL